MESNQNQNQKQKENLNKYLEDIFNNVNHWLGFAEAKNGAVAALVLAWLAVIQEYKSDDECIFWVTFILSGISLCIALISFMPNTSEVISDISEATITIERIDNENSRDKKNLLFFTNIASYKDGVDYLKEIVSNYLTLDSIRLKELKYECDLADEIIQNSKICSQKYKFFKWAVCFLVLAVALFVLLNIKKKYI